MISSGIPKLPYKFFKWFCRESYFEELQGDLEENFLINLEKDGKKKAQKFIVLKVIVGLLGKDLYWILGIAMIAGLTTAYFVVNTVFDIIYAYHVVFSFNHFLLSIISLFAIVIFTIGCKVVQIGKQNPVEQLRME
jgi:hypothetical protein